MQVKTWHLTKENAEDTESNKTTKSISSKSTLPTSRKREVKIHLLKIQEQREVELNLLKIHRVHLLIKEELPEETVIPAYW